MDRVWFSSVSVLLLVLSALTLYQYVRSYSVDRFDREIFCRLEIEFKPAVFFLSVLILSFFLYFLNYQIRSEAFLRSYMHAQVFVWLAALSYLDIKDQVIPNPLIAAGLVFWAVLIGMDILVAGTPWKSVLIFSLLGGGIFGGVMLLIATFARSALGMGDVKMFFVIGLMYGLNDTYTIMMVSLILMAAVSIGMLALKKATTKTAVPMAPFVAVGFLAGVLAGI